MKKTPQILLCLSVVGVFLLAFAAPAHANCTLLSQVVFHGLGGKLENCAEPATGYIYAVDEPDITRSIFKAGHPSAGLPMVTVCNASAANGGTTDAGGVCQDQAGTVSDGFVTVQFDWGSGSFAEGCPNPTGSGTGTTPIAIEVTDALGNAVTLVTGFSVTFSGFLVDNAHVNDGSDLPLPISCTNPAQRGNVELLSLTDVNPTLRLVTVNVKSPDRAAGVYCDCDTGALGTTFADQSCGTRSCGSDLGQVYSRIGPCAGLTDPFFRNTADWTLEGTPDVTGNFTVSTDPSALEPNCLIGPNFCLSPPSAVPDPCTSNADCVRDDCQFVGATNLYGPVVAGTCDPPTCNITDLGPCTEFAPGFVRCAGDLNIACTLPDGLECISGACAIGSATCTLDSQCPGECLSGNTGATCTTDADCSSLPESAQIGGGFLAIGGPAAASDRAVARLAELGKNVLKVEFTVSLEQHAHSFDILAGGVVLNDSPILAENRGTYVAEIAKAGGKLKGAKEITVRTNLDGGGTLMSDPLTIKRGNK